jgi:ubiquinone/menaquinone biosynthesis C-methylase UbiE
MTTNVAGFTGSIPENYDQGLGPILFADYAADIARRVAALGPKRVLETAAGTGIVTRRLKDALPSAEITATDLNPPMLDIAKAKFKPNEAINFQPADAQALPFPDNSFDAMVCQFGVMFYPDKEKSYREAFRVLTPGGRYLFNVWDSIARNRFAGITHEIVSRFFATDPPQFYQTPFGYYKIDPIKEALLEAGFRELNIAVVKNDKRIPDPVQFARGVVFGNPLIDQIKARGGFDPEEVFEAVKDALVSEYAAKPAPLQAIVFEAGKPS